MTLAIEASALTGGRPTATQVPGTRHRYRDGTLMRETEFNTVDGAVGAATSKKP